MYYVIVATSGYVESSQLGHTIWLHQAGGFEDPIEALKSLASDLLTVYLENLLFSYEDSKNAPICHRWNKPHGTKVYCEKCGACLRPIFDPVDFMNWVYNLPNSNASAGPVCLGDDLREWWPWLTFDEIFSYTPNEIIVIDEYFDSFILTACDSPNLTNEERFDLKLFLEDEGNILLPKISISDHKTCKLEMRYPHLEK